jgi:hypothetical protein
MSVSVSVCVCETDIRTGRWGGGEEGWGTERREERKAGEGGTERGRRRLGREITVREEGGGWGGGEQRGGVGEGENREEGGEEGWGGGGRLGNREGGRGRQQLLC